MGWRVTLTDFQLAQHYNFETHFVSIKDDSISGGGGGVIARTSAVGILSLGRTEN